MDYTIIILVATIIGCIGCGLFAEFMISDTKIRLDPIKNIIPFLKKEKVFKGTYPNVDFEELKDGARIVCKHGITKSYEISYIKYDFESPYSREKLIFPLRFGYLNTVFVKNGKLIIKHSLNPLNKYENLGAFINGKRLPQEEVFVLKNLEKDELENYYNMLILKDSDI